MYQLSHLLSEQRSLLNTMLSTSIFQNQEILPLNESENCKDEDENIELKRKQTISDISEKIEGCIVSDFCTQNRPYFLRPKCVNFSAESDGKLRSSFSLRRRSN